MSEISSTPSSPSTSSQPSAAPSTSKPSVGSQAVSSNSTAKSSAPGKPGADSAKAVIQGAKEVQNQAQEEIRKIKLKIYGKEQSMTEPEVVKLAQQAEAANKRWIESKNLERQNQQMLAALKDPAQLSAVLKHLGYSDDQIDSISEQRLASKIERKMMQETNPEKIKTMELEEKLRFYEDQEKREKESRQKTEHEKLVQAQREEYDLKITAAMEKENLPKTEYTLDKFVKYMRKAIELGYDHVTPESVAPLVAQDYQRDYQTFLSKIDLDHAQKFLPKDFLDKLRKHDLQKLQNPNKAVPFAIQPDGKPHSKEDDEDRERSAKRMTKNDWKKMIDKKIS